MFSRMALVWFLIGALSTILVFSLAMLAARRATETETWTYGLDPDGEEFWSR